MAGSAETPVRASEGDPSAFVQSRTAWFAVAVAALGYFVDVFDLWLFANFRVPSLTSLGLPADQITDTGAYLINCQQTGLLLGGFVWGIMGDKRGRVSVMFGSILLYSVATIANAFVTTVPQYAALRFVTGFGLSGEIGAGITLVSELLPKEKRGYGTTIVATLGVAGAIAAAYVGKVMSWQNAFILGGSLGFVLLAMRLAVYESGMYNSVAADSGVKRGSLRLLFKTRQRTMLFLSCILVGIPIYAIFGLLATFAPEIAKSLELSGTLSVPDVMIYSSLGITVGDLASGLLSQAIKSRKRPILYFLMFGFLGCLAIYSGYVKTAEQYCWAAALAGFGVGCWACLITSTAEQFGTNLRATVTTTVPNLVRASAIPLNMAFVYLKGFNSPSVAAFIITLVYFALAFIALSRLRETYGTNLDFVEE